MDTESDVLRGSRSLQHLRSGPSLSIRRSGAVVPPTPRQPLSRPGLPVAVLPLRRFKSFLEDASLRKKKFESAPRVLKKRKDTPAIPSPVAAKGGREGTREGGRGWERGVGVMWECDELAGWSLFQDSPL